MKVTNHSSCYPVCCLPANRGVSSLKHPEYLGKNSPILLTNSECLVEKNLVSKHNFFSEINFLPWQFPRLIFPKIALEFWGMKSQKRSAARWFLLPQRPSWIHCSSPTSWGDAHATGGTQDFIEQLKLPVIPVEDVTDYPSILGRDAWRLFIRKILEVFKSAWNAGMSWNGRIPDSGYWFSNRWPLSFLKIHSPPGQMNKSIIEKIDIGGISWFIAAAKRISKDVVIIPSRDQYSILSEILENQNGELPFEDRKRLAVHAFEVTSHYDSAIFFLFQCWSVQAGFS